MTPIKSFFCWCSGANLKILSKIEIEQDKFASVGATIFITAFLAFLSGSYAFFTIFDSTQIAIPIGIAWAITIFSQPLKTI
jgi:hypothetical protein